MFRYAPATLDIREMASRAQSLPGVPQPHVTSDTMAAGLAALRARSAIPTPPYQEHALARHPMTRLRVPATQDSTAQGLAAARARHATKTPL